jgi:DNA (cytosine-5)-methyltransferase 1
VDLHPQPRYPFTFVQMDALAVEDAFDLRAFDAIHASPPCQFASAGGHIWESRLGPASERHPNLIPPTRALLERAGRPYVIENVERARAWLKDPSLLCGLALGLGVKRHRLFETTFPMMVPPCHSNHEGEWISVFGGGALSRTPRGGQARVNGKHNGKGANDGRVHISHEDAKRAMGIDWMQRDEMSEAIPPAYTELIGHQLMQSLQVSSTHGAS